MLGQTQQKTSKDFLNNYKIPNATFGVNHFGGKK